MGINLNKVLLNYLVCLISIQAVVLLSQVLGAAQLSPAVVNNVLPENAASLYPKWDLVLYIAFITAALLGHLIASRVLAKAMTGTHWWRGVLSYALVESILTFLLLTAVFKRTIYDNSPLLAQRATLVLLAAALLIKLFWGEARQAYFKLQAWALTRANKVAWLKAADAVNVAGIAMIIYLPDPLRVAAQFFIGEQFHHFDYFLMSPGWASLNGVQPYVGVISQYGVGAPYILSRLCALWGGFDYVPALKMFVALVIIYYVLFYAFMRAWLGSRILAMAAFLVAFRLQMFHYGVNPLCWTYPSTTPLRFGLDILWLWALLLHLRTERMRYLHLAALYSGFALFYMTSTGACVAATFYFYLLALLLIKPVRQWDPPRQWQYALCFIWPLAAAAAFFGITLREAAFNRLFWHNMLEYMVFFAHGHAGGVLPIYESLKYRHHWAFFMAVALPLTYVMFLFTAGGLVLLRRAKAEHLMAAVVAVYGLCNYQYFVVRSAVTSYYMNALPFVLLAAYLLYVALPLCAMNWRRRVLAGAFVLSAYALLTNHNYISYPNLFNFSRNPMVDGTVAQHFPDRQGYFNHTVKPIKEEDKVPLNAAGNSIEDLRTEDSFSDDAQLKQYFVTHFDFSKDAAMIASLTLPNERVPVLSSFETKILMQAKRPPFFYHIPLITSYPMWLRFFPSDAAHSPNFLKDTLGQLQQQKPKYVFIERVFLQDKIPSSYDKNNANILTLVRYIRANYVPVQTGQYLAAMKLRE